MVRAQNRTTFLTRDKRRCCAEERTSATLFVALYGGMATRCAMRWGHDATVITMRARPTPPTRAPVFRNTTIHDTTVYEVAQARSGPGWIYRTKNSYC